jgi:hypothetical protein
MSRTFNLLNVLFKRLSSAVAVLRTALCLRRVVPLPPTRDSLAALAYLQLLRHTRTCCGSLFRSFDDKLRRGMAYLRC